MKVTLISLGLFALAIQSQGETTESALPISADVSLPNAEVPSQFPWQVAIYDSDRYLGGGSLISDSWVLTVAKNCFSHCSVTLKLGTVNHNDADAVTMTSADMHIHPQYKHQRYANNICLIKLPNAVEFSQKIATLKLISSEQKSKTFLDQMAAISGFSALANNQNISKAEVKIVENENCNGYFAPSLIENSFCVQGNDNVAYALFCRTEFGIPMVVQDAEGHWLQIGIKSVKAHDRCHAGSYSIYQKLAPFLDYIYSTTGISHS